jgi:hypothetical protein
MAINWIAVLSCMAALLERLQCVGCCEAGAHSSPLRGGKGLGAWVPLLPLEGFDKALQAQVFIPLLGECLMLAMKFGVEDVLAWGDEARPLLDAKKIVAVEGGVQIQIYPYSHADSKHISGSRLASPFCSP